MSDKKVDGRIDEYAAEVFGAMGHDKRNLPPKIVEFYKTFKKAKDAIQPGRLTPGEFATIALLASLYNQPVVEGMDEPDHTTGE